MTHSPDPIYPHITGEPSRVIQGFFPGGKPWIIQTSRASATPVRPTAPVPLPARSADKLLQTATRPGQPPPPIVTTNGLHRGAVQPASPTRSQASRSILPQRAGPAAMQPHAGDAFPLPGNLTLKPRGSGQPLPEPIQKKMESFFNTSFADVRVHVGPEAPSIGALAFTHGTDLYFAPGQYNPHSSHGQQLLGHELTHVLQQRAGRVRNPLGAELAVVQDPALEAEAERMGLRAASLQIQAKPAGTGQVVASSQATGPRSKVVAANGAILPARSLAQGPVQRKTGPILPVRAVDAGKTVPGSFSSCPSRRAAVQGVPCGPRSQGVVQQAPLMLTDRPWEEVEELERQFGRTAVREGRLVNFPTRSQMVRRLANIPRSLIPGNNQPPLLPPLDKSKFIPFESTRDKARGWNLEGVYDAVLQVLICGGISPQNAEGVLDSMGENRLQALLTQFTKVEKQACDMLDVDLPFEKINRMLAKSKHLCHGFFSTCYITIPITSKNTTISLPAKYFRLAHEARKMLLGDTGTLSEDPEKVAICAALFLEDVFLEYGITIPIKSGLKRILIMITPTLIHTAIHEAIHLNARDDFKAVFGNLLNEGLTEWLAKAVCEEFGVSRANVYQAEVNVINVLVNLGFGEELKDALFLGRVKELKSALLKTLGKIRSTEFTDAAKSNNLEGIVTTLQVFLKEGKK